MMDAPYVRVDLFHDLIKAKHTYVVVIAPRLSTRVRVSKLFMSYELSAINFVGESSETFAG